MTTIPTSFGVFGLNILDFKAANRSHLQTFNSDYYNMYTQKMFQINISSISKRVKIETSPMITEYFRYFPEKKSVFFHYNDFLRCYLDPIIIKMNSFVCHTKCTVHI